MRIALGLSTSAPHLPVGNRSPTVAASGRSSAHWRRSPAPGRHGRRGSHRRRRARDDAGRAFDADVARPIHMGARRELASPGRHRRALGATRGRDFRTRNVATARRYTYVSPTVRCARRSRRPRRLVPSALDLPLMLEAAMALVDTHDFPRFAPPNARRDRRRGRYRRRPSRRKADTCISTFARAHSFNT
jgi:hypothetical protein